MQKNNDSVKDENSPENNEEEQKDEGERSEDERVREKKKKGLRSPSARESLFSVSDWDTRLKIIRRRQSGTIVIRTGKVTLFIVDIFVWASGITLLAMGLLCFFGQKEIYLLADVRSRYLAASFMIIFTGGFSMLLSCFGCITEHNRKKIILYIIFSAVLFFVQLTSTILFYLEKEMITTYFKPESDVFKEKYGKEPHVTSIVDTAQEKFHCCGWNGPTEWPESYFWRAQNISSSHQLPLSCCKEESLSTCNTTVPSFFTEDDLKFQDLHLKPCSSTFQGWLKDFVDVASAVALAASILNFMGFCIAVTVYICLKRTAGFGF